MTLAIGLFVLAVLAVVGALVSVFLGAGKTGDQNVEILIGQTRLLLPQAYIRNPENRRRGEFIELDLAASARDFRPASAPLNLRPGVEDASADIVYLNLREADKSPDPAERPARLYMRFLESDSWSHPGGLIMRRFETGSPYGREDLYMAPPEGRVFAARCIRPAQPPDGLPNTCIAELREYGLDIRLRFSPNLLADWEHLLAGVHGLMKAFKR